MDRVIADNEWRNHAPLLSESTVTDEQARQAQLTVCDATGDAMNARELLDMLGLLPQAPDPAQPRWAPAQIVPASPMPTREELDEMHAWMVDNGYANELEEDQ